MKRFGILFLSVFLIGLAVALPSYANSGGGAYTGHRHPTRTPQPGARVTVRGVIESQDSGVWMISGVAVTVNDQTLINDRQGQAVVGAWVEAKAVRQDDDSLLATVIMVKGHNDHPGDRLEFMGEIQAMSDDAWTIGGFDFKVDAQTRIDEREGQAQVGTLAIVAARRLEDDSLYASRIHIKDDAPDGAKIEFRGPIEAMSSNQWTVAGFDLIVDDGTVIDHPERAAAGVAAGVKARRQDDGSLLAIEIDVKGRAAEMRHSFQWKGILESFDDASWMISGRTVQINDDTVIIGEPEVGALVEVRAIQQDDGSLLALWLHVKQAQDVMKFHGVVKSIDAETNTWVIGDYTVKVDARTVLSERHGPIDVGVMVKVNAQRQDDGSWLALRIKSEN